MTGRPGGERGLPRGAALAALSALLTAVGHVAGGGALPDLAVLVVLLPLLAGVFVTLATWSRSGLGMIATLGAGQLTLHQLMALLQPAHHAMDPAVPTGPGMLAMHVAGTLVTALALRHADHAMVALGAALRRVVPRRLHPPPATRPLPTRAAPGPAVSLRLARALAVAHIRRGPPVRC